MREEEKNKSSQESGFKRFAKKRWVYPAIYIASAAIILTAVLWYQNSSNSVKDPNSFDYNATDVPGKKYNEPAVEVNRAMENILMPVKDQDSAVIQKHFYDMNGKAEDQEAALVFYNNRYHPNTGIDITMEDGKTFDVVAAMSGTVTKVENDALLGNVIEIEHDKGIVTQYQSVTDMNVQVGDQVEQGQALAKAGESLINEEAGLHVHFEIRKDGVPVNPHDFFQKPLSSLQELKPSESNSPDENAAEDKPVEEGNIDKDENDVKNQDSKDSSPSDSDKKDEAAESKGA